jgi:hypothetical protein
MGKILYMSNKRVGSGFKTQVYMKGNGAFGVIEPSTLTKFGNGLFGTATRGVVPFLGGEGVHQKPKNISQRVRKLL